MMIFNIYTALVLYSTVQYSTVQYTAVQYSTVQYSTVQYSTVQYSTVLYSTLQCGTIHNRNLFSTLLYYTIQCYTNIDRTIMYVHWSVECELWVYDPRGSFTGHHRAATKRKIESINVRQNIGRRIIEEREQGTK